MLPEPSRFFTLRVKEKNPATNCTFKLKFPFNWVDGTPLPMPACTWVVPSTDDFSLFSHTCSPTIVDGTIQNAVPETLTPEYMKLDGLKTSR